jgi:hypothetical protein
VLFIFGGLSPCNTLRDSLRTQIQHDGGIASSLLPVMPESTLIRLTSVSSDKLNVGQCFKFDLTGETGLPPLSIKAGFPAPAVMAKVGKTILSSIQECRDKRLKNVLKTHVDSVQCSNTAIVAAYTMAGYPYMDIVRTFTDKRLDLAAQLDKDNLTQIDEQQQIEDTMVAMVKAERERLAK